MRFIEVSPGGTTEPPKSGPVASLPGKRPEALPVMPGVNMLMNKHLVCYLVYNFLSNVVKHVQALAAETEDVRKSPASATFVSSFQAIHYHR